MLWVSFANCIGCCVPPYRAQVRRDIMEGLINKMRNILRDPSLPSRGLALGTAKKTSSKRHIPGGLLPGHGRMRSGHQSPAGSLTSLYRHPTPAILVFLAVLALGLLFLLPGGLLQAQNDGMIDYAENEMDAVATFTADDPEDRMVYWSLAPAGTDPDGDGDLETADAADAAEFSISSDGVLSFRFSPDYEMPRGEARGDNNTNTYKVVVVASDNPIGAGTGEMPIMMGHKGVTVNVTDVDEPGMVTLSAQQGQVGVALTATLTDDDATGDQIGDAKWKWEHSSTENGPWTEILTTTDMGYTPLGVEDKYLRVTATYTDRHGSDKSEMAVSAHTVRAAPPNNAMPVFTDEDDATQEIDVVRKVDENSPPGTNVGKPVTANDTLGDVLTYTFGTDDDEASYRIDPATGQITVGPRTALDRDGSPPNETDMVSVIATDPSGGATAPQEVTITINDVNESPMITAGVTRASVGEGAAIATAVSTYTATDVDQTGDVTWSVSGTDAGDFEISNEAATRGQLTFKEAPNYEMPADSNKDNVYMVTVVATDAGVDDKNKMTAERAVVITVENLEEAGTVSLSSVQPKIGFPLTASVTDPDGGEMGTTWKWERDDGTADNPTTDCTTVTEDDWEDAVDGMGAKTATYTPDAKDEGKCLRATATYTDGKGMDDAMDVSANAVEMDEANRPPRFRAGGVDDDDTTLANTGDTAMSAKRSIAENVEPDTTEVTNPANVGEPVVADDPNDDNLTYTLNGNDAGSFDIGSADGQISAKMKLDHEAKSSHMVKVTATDPDGASASIDVTITVNNVDEAPKIAGDDVTTDYRENGTAQVARFTADDPEDRMVYWSLETEDVTGVDGIGEDDEDDHAEFSISPSGVLSFKFSPDYEMPRGEARGDNNTNTYRVVVVASDDPTGAGDAIMMGHKKVNVNVTDMEETETVTLSAQQGQVGVALTATYNDADEERPADRELTWQWYLGTPIPGATAMTHTPENPGTHRVEASYTKTDGSKKAVSATISVRAVPSANNATPVFPSGSDARSVDENSPPGTKVGSPVKANDTGGDRLHHTLGGINEALFDINPATGQITVAARITLDADDGTPTRSVTVTATDPWGQGATPTGQAIETVTITINNVNEAPMVNAGPTTHSRDEGDLDPNADGVQPMVGTYTATDDDQDVTAVPLIWSVSGTDMGDFEISNEAATRGQLTFKEAPNYEMPADSNRDNVYMVTVVATDAGVDDKNKMTAERAVVVTVENLVEAGTVSLSSVQPKIGFPLTASVTDPDGGEMGTTWKWERDDGTADNPTTDCTTVTEDDWEDAVDGMGAKTATYTPDAKDEGKCLRATATYTDDKGMDVAMAASTNAVIEDRANRPPRFRAGGVDDDDTTLANTGDTAMSAKRSIAENVEPDTTELTNPANVGMPVVADDPNGDTLTYTLSGNDAGPFMIDPSDGQISAKMKLDKEAKSSHIVTVTATDPNGASASIDVTIMVTDMDEAPVIERGGLAISGMSSVSYAENGTDAVEEYTLAGPMKDKARWALEGDDASDFTLMNGTLNFKRIPNYEMPMDSDTDNVYMVTVKAMDGTYTAMKPVTVTVTNVDEIGTLSGPETVSNYMENSEDAVGTYTVTGGSMSAMANLTLMGDDADDFSRIMDDGMLKFSSPPDFEAPADTGMDNTYMVTVKAEAGGEMAMRPVTVTVINDEEPGRVTLWAGADALTMAPQVGDTITGAVMDPDGGVTGETWQWSRTMTPDMMDSWMDITDATNAAYMVMEGDTGYHLRVMATYMDAVGTDTDMAYSPATMMVGAMAEQMGEVTLRDGTDALTMAPQVGDTITGLVEDPDGGVTGETWQWSRTMTPDMMDSWMDIDATEAAYMVMAGDEGYHLRVMATYMDAVGTDTDMAYSPATMMVEAAEEMTLLGRYDTTPQDGSIQLEEARAAVGDYFVEPKGTVLSLEDAREVVGLYFEYKNSQSQ